MSDINFTRMMELQRNLQDAHKGKWTPLSPLQARNQLLWLMEELGEVIAIIKKKGETAIMEDPAVRANFCTEMCDVLMYFNDVLICYDISPEEISKAYEDKYSYNMARDYDKQNKKLYTENPLKSD